MNNEICRMQQETASKLCYREGGYDKTELRWIHQLRFEQQTSKEQSSAKH
jgi:hypothetical protein